MIVVHHGNDLEALAEGCAARVISEDPLTPGFIVVPGNAMAKWLSLELARRNGIAAHLHFLSPVELITRFFCSSGADDSLSDWFSADRLGWRLLSLFQPGQEKRLPGFLQQYLSRSGDPAAATALARRLGEQLQEYLIYRYDVLAEWERGEGRGWQAELWRSLTDVNGHRPATEISDILSQQTQPKAPEEVGGLSTLSVFGLPSAPPLMFEVLQRLDRRGVTIDLFAMSPSAQYWADLMTPRQVAESALDESEAQAAIGHRVLANLGQQGREYHGLWVDRLTSEGRDRDYYTEPGSESVLGQLRWEIYSLAEKDPAPVPEQRSLQLHACPGAMREVQVLHDRLLDLFESLPDLQPEHVAILVPDMQAYAPLIEAEFGSHDEIPFSLVRRGDAPGHDAAMALIDCLHLASSRLTASDVMSFIARPAVSERFAFSADDLSLLTEWAELASIRWGRDGAMRKALDLGSSEAFTWRRGIDRLLLGYAGGDQLLHEEIAGVAAVEGAEADLAGRWFTAIDCLMAFHGNAQQTHTISAWRALLASLIDDLFGVDQSLGLRRAIVRLEEQAKQHDIDGRVGIAWVTSLLRQLLEDSGVPSTFLAGGVTVADARMMRGIPFRVICVPGLNAGTFPAQDRRAADDLLYSQPRAGDRSRRLDDRWLFLECLLSARDALVMSYTSRDPSSDALQPPSTVAKELTQWYRSRFRDSASKPASLTTHHPVSSRSRQYFEADSPLFSYRPKHAKAAATTSERGKRHLLIEPGERLPSDKATAFTLRQLQAFFRNPARTLLARMGAGPVSEHWLEDDEPFALGGLDRYSVADYWIDALATGASEEETLRRLRALDWLPEGSAGEQQCNELLHSVSEHWRMLSPRVPVSPQPFELKLGPFLLRGALMGGQETGFMWLSPSKGKPAHYLSWWLAHLCWNCAKPADAGGHSQCHFLDGEILTLAPIADASARLQLLLEFFVEGRHSLFRFEPDSAMAAAEVMHGPEPDEAIALEKAEKAWDEAWNPSWSGASDWYWQQLLPAGELIDADYVCRAVEIFGPLLEARDG